MNIETDQAGRRPGGLPGVDSHPHANRFTGWPCVRQQLPLHLDRRGNAGARGREHGEERITLGVYLLTVVGGQGIPDEQVMIGQGLGVRVTEALQQRSGALDVGKEKGERLRGHW